MPKALLLEVGSDEIPARYLPLAFRELRDRAESALKEARVGYESISVFGTPRRLALFAPDLAEKSDDISQKVRGPSKKAAYDHDGRPTKALLGFARSIGADPAEVTIEPESGGEYVYGIKHEKGRPVQHILEKILPGVVMGMECPHPLRWGEQDWRWYRAIRWVVCLYGAEIVALEIAGKRSGRTSHGHRTLHPGPVEIHEADKYFDIMADSGVIVDQESRKARVIEGAKIASAEISGVPLIDDDLLTEVVCISEHPSAFLGRFDEKYLNLPEEVLITAMRHHQRYFPVSNGSGRVLPGFVGVRDGDPHQGIDTVRMGNQWVLRARLADAGFFYDQDIKIPLGDRLDDLKGVRFLREAGSMYEKTLRLTQIADDMASQIGLAAEESERAVQAATLAKCDLVTALVREFPELEGVMGGIYAAREGLHPEVCAALAQQYLPRGSKDAVPQAGVSSVLAISDKIDTLAVAFSLGIEVSGSQDPLGLRRAAQGIISTLLAHGYDVDLDRLIDMPLELAKGVVTKASASATERLSAFLLSRVEASLSEKGYQTGVVKAVLGGRERRVPRIVSMAEALSELLGAPQLGDILTGWRRTGVLGKASTSRQVTPELLQEEAESRLYHEVTRQSKRLRELLDNKDYRGYLLQLAGLRLCIDECLDHVMIMVEDDSLKANRLALLGTVSDLFTHFADFSQVLSLV